MKQAGACLGAVNVWCNGIMPFIHHLLPDPIAFQFQDTLSFNIKNSITFG